MIFLIYKYSIMSTNPVGTVEPIYPAQPAQSPLPTGPLYMPASAASPVRRKGGRSRRNGRKGGSRRRSRSRRSRHRSRRGRRRH